MLRASDPSSTRPQLEALEDRVVPAGLVGDLVIFGDSLSDTGNVSIASTLAGGPTIPSPTDALGNPLYFQGRFSGGPIWVDTLAEYLGEATSTPALAGGLNYAFGRAPIVAYLDPDEPTAVPTIAEQMGLYLASHTPDNDDLFVVWAGANDFFDSLRAFQGGAMNFTTFMAQSGASAAALGDAIEGLIGRGAEQFVVANLPPLGATPFFQDIGDLNLIGAANAWTASFNDALSDELDALDDDADILPLDINALFTTLTTRNPLDLTDFDDAVGPYDFDSTFLHRITDDPDQFLFYDSVHPGSRTHQYAGLQAAADVMEHLGISTVWVKTTDDTVDPLDGEISLREAVNLTNAMSGEQTLFFALGHGPKTITLGSELAITGDTNIVGTGTSKLAISGADTTRIFNIAAGAEITLAAMTLRNGKITGPNARGGAIYNAGDLTVIDVVFKDNSAIGANAAGGAIYNVGDLEVYLSAFVNNNAAGTGATGGAIATGGTWASTAVSGSVLTGNQARGSQARGGAIHAGADMTLTLVLSAITGNKAIGSSALGGGVYVGVGVDFTRILTPITANTGGNLFVA